ncbi:caspase family protein, partial [bacterium]|nr:caspase family protein [bacterium]
MNAKMPAAIAAAMALVFILGLAAPARTAPAWYPRSVALVIGVTPYGGGFRTLPSARESAQNIENTLRANGFQVLTLYDRQATRDAIVGFLTSPLVRGLGPQDRFVFYFAGHGHTVTGVGLDGATGFIVPADGNRLGGEPDLRTLVGVRELQKELATRTAVKQATFIFDAQFEDAAVKPVSRDAVSPLSYVGQPASNVLIAGGAFSAFGGADLFSNAVAAAFNGYADANRDGFVTFGEVATYVEAVTGRQQSRRVIAGSFEGGGQLVFKYAGEPPVMVASATPALPTPARDAPGTPAALGGRVTLPPEQARTAA